MNPYDEQNSAAWWIAGAVGFVVGAWKLFFNLKHDSRTDREGRGRADLIERLESEIKRQSELIKLLTEANDRLSDQIDKEVERRRIAEDMCFECGQREKRLLRRIKDLGGEEGD